MIGSARRHIPEQVGIDCRLMRALGEIGAWIDRGLAHFSHMSCNCFVIDLNLFSLQLRGDLSIAIVRMCCIQLVNTMLEGNLFG